MVLTSEIVEIKQVGAEAAESGAEAAESERRGAAKTRDLVVSFISQGSILSV